MNTLISRRRFIKASAATAGMFFIVPSHTVSGLGYIAPRVFRNRNRTR
jgi:hypothetical protein